MSGEKVIYLAFSNPRLEPDALSFTACRHCRNKTFTLRHDGGDFPLMCCAACGAHIGRVGWTDDED